MSRGPAGSGPAGPNGSGGGHAAQSRASPWGEAGASLAALAAIRLELASLELAEERERLLTRLALVLAGILLMAIAVLALAATVLVLLWDRYRLAALLGTALLCGGGGWALLWQAGRMARLAGIPFAATRAEFDQDRSLLFDPVGPPDEAPTTAHDDAPPDSPAWPTASQAEHDPS